MDDQNYLISPAFVKRVNFQQNYLFNFLKASNLVIQVEGKFLMATNKLYENCNVDLIIISARDMGAEFFIAQNSEVEKAYRHLVNKTVEAFRDADSSQH